MKIKFSTKFVLTLSIITMLLFLASNGCSHNSSDTPPGPSAQIKVSSRQITHGNVVQNNSSDQTVSIQNTGSLSLTIGQIAQANPLAPPFSIVSDQCSGLAVLPSATCSFKVRFSPTSQASFTDSFDIPSNASNESSVTVNVSGTGIAQSSALITVSSHQVSFGNVVLNTVSDQTFSIQNTGSINLTIGQIAHANALGAPFSIVSDLCSGLSVSPSAACSFIVRFSPTSQGIFSDNFDIPSDAPNENSVAVNCLGIGKALRFAVNQVITTSCSTGVLELIINVTDQNNVPLPGLIAGDFQIIENGVPRTINSVTPISTPVPISVAMLLDYSNSVANQMPIIEGASINFIGHLNPLADKASIIKFAQFPQLMQDFTSDQGLLITAITTTPTQLGIAETALYDALYFAVNTDITETSSNRKAIVLVSDGVDEDINGVPNLSNHTLDQVIAYATQNHVAIYTVGLGNKVNGGVMNRLAGDTGGQYYYITNAGQLSGVYQAISDILLGQYSIKYVSSSTGSSPIMLEINVVNGAAAGAAAGAGATQVTGCP